MCIYKINAYKCLFVKERRFPKARSNWWKRAWIKQRTTVRGWQRQGLAWNLVECMRGKPQQTENVDFNDFEKKGNHSVAKKIWRVGKQWEIQPSKLWAEQGILDVYLQDQCGKPQTRNHP